MAPSTSRRRMWVLGVLLGGVAGAGSALLWDRRLRRARAPPELDRLVQGRQSVVDLLARDGPLDFASVHARLRPPPTPESLADWLASLIADGTLRGAMDGDGRARFSRTEDSPRAPQPRVTLDPHRAERLIDRIDELREEARSVAGKGL